MWLLVWLCLCGVHAYVSLPVSSFAHVLLVGAECDAGGVGEGGQGQGLEQLLAVALPRHDAEQAALGVVDACVPTMYSAR